MVQCLRVTKSIVGFVDIDRVPGGILIIKVKSQKLSNRKLCAFLSDMIYFPSSEVCNSISHLSQLVKYDCKIHSMRYNIKNIKASVIGFEPTAPTHMAKKHEISSISHNSK